MNQMNIVCSFDNGYSPYAGAMLTSLFENNKAREITVYVLTDYIDKVNLQKFDILSETYSQKIIIKLINKELFEGLPHGGRFQNISLAAYYRLLIDVVLPQDIERVLYLDCDIIVNGSLKELFEIEILHDWQVVALKDSPNVADRAVERLGLGRNSIYINSGVMLINLEALRKIQFSQQSFDYLRTNVEKILYHDQDVINVILTKKEILPLRYNVLDCVLMMSPIVSSFYSSLELNDAVLNPVVIHYSGVRKPWHKECNHPYKYLYKKYLELSPWKGTPPINKYKGFSATFLFRFKSVIKYVLLFVGKGQFVYKNIPLKRV